MKKIILLFLILGCSLFTVNAQNWLWGREGKPIPSGNGDVLLDHTVAVNDSGYAYFVGTFGGNLTYGPSNLVNSISTQAAFIVKCDINGNFLWARQSSVINSNSYAMALSVAVDDYGGVYEGGYFSDTIAFGTFGLKSKKGDMYFVKYNSSGNVLWVKQATPITKGSVSSANSIAFDRKNNVYVTGGFADTVAFNIYTLKTSTSASDEVFLVKYDTTGNVIWARQSTGNNISNAAAYSVATDNVGNIYIAGYFTDTVTFGSIVLKENSPNGSIFLAKYDSNGNIIWARQALQASKASWGCAYSVAVDGNDAIYITGNFTDTLSFGTITLKTAITGGDVFLVKYDSTGKVIWGKQGFSVNNSDWIGFSVAADTLKRGGGFLEISGSGPASPITMEFDKDTFNLKTYNPLATIILQFDSAGSVKCGSIFSEGNEDDGDGVGVDKAGEYAYLAGDLVDTAIFGKDTLDYGIYSDEPYLARWQPCSSSTEGVNEIKPDNSQVILYPNPNNGYFQLSVVSSQLSGKSQIEVYNVLGQKVYINTFSTPQATFHINEPPGLYLFRVTTENGDIIGEGKFILE